MRVNVFELGSQQKFRKEGNLTTRVKIGLTTYSFLVLDSVYGGCMTADAYQVHSVKTKSYVSLLRNAKEYIDFLRKNSY